MNTPKADCCATEQLARQAHLEALYEADGRHDPSHPSHGIYTGLFADRIEQLIAGDRAAANGHLPDRDAPLYAVLLPFIGRGLIEDPEAARAICAAWCRGTSSRLVWAVKRLEAEGDRPGQQPLIDGCGAISSWLLHEALRAELGE